MEEPQKPFACTMPDCGMTFTNEDHLHVHTKKHDMVLQLGLEQKGAFVADQTPTPTRFIRNCEEVGLFQDLQNVNPFDEGFKRAMETKQSILSLENIIASSTEDLHTPQMVYPLVDVGDSTLFSTTNNQRNITISRSSSDESGAIKEFETTTISKLTNEVTTISRIVEKHDDQTKNESFQKENQLKKDSVSYTNNFIKIHSNIEIRKDHDSKNLLKEGNLITKDVMTSESKLNVPVPPIMSQKSIDLVVDSLTTDLCYTKEDSNQQKKANSEKSENYEVIIKLPNGRQVRMKSVEEINSAYDKVEQLNAKDRLKKAIAEKKKPVVQETKHQNVPVVPSIVPITGTLIPVTLVNPIVPKIPILPLNVEKNLKRKSSVSDRITNNIGKTVNCDRKSNSGNVNGLSMQRDSRKDLMESRNAASRRYRARLKEAWMEKEKENKQLKEINEILRREMAVLKKMITEHMKKCSNADDLRLTNDKMKL